MKKLFIGITLLLSISAFAKSKTIKHKDCIVSKINTSSGILAESEIKIKESLEAKGYIVEEGVVLNDVNAPYNKNIDINIRISKIGIQAVQYPDDINPVSRFFSKIVNGAVDARYKGHFQDFDVCTNDGRDKYRECYRSYSKKFSGLLDDNDELETAMTSILRSMPLCVIAK